MSLGTRRIEFKRITDDRGDLIVIDRCLPFEVRRLFYIKDVPFSGNRGAHAHRTGEQILIPISGRFTVVATDGVARETYHLGDDAVGLYIPAMIWIVLHSFLYHAICLVLTSNHYDEEDHIRSYDDFLARSRSSCTIPDH